MLALFERYEVRATWRRSASCSSKSAPSCCALYPRAKPTYSEANYSPYGEIAAIGVNESSDPCRLGRSLVALIAAHADRKSARTPSATISRSRPPDAGCLPPGSRGRRRCANRAGHEVRSLVFPRNQCNEAYLPLCSEAGIQCFRGNPRSWLYRARPRSEERASWRALRLLDAYINISGHHTYRRMAPGTGRSPPSTFPRAASSGPGRPLPALARMPAAAADQERDDACRPARRGFPPLVASRELRANCAQNLRCLEAVLQHFASLRDRHGMESLNIGDFGSASVKRARQAARDRASFSQKGPPVCDENLWPTKDLSGQSVGRPTGDDSIPLPGLLARSNQSPSSSGGELDGRSKASVSCRVPLGLPTQAASRCARSDSFVRRPGCGGQATCQTFALLLSVEVAIPCDEGRDARLDGGGGHVADQAVQEIGARDGLRYLAPGRAGNVASRADRECRLDRLHETHQMHGLAAPDIDDAVGGHRLSVSPGTVAAPIPGPAGITSVRRRMLSTRSSM